MASILVVGTGIAVFRRAEGAAERQNDRRHGLLGQTYVLPAISGGRDRRISGFSDIDIYYLAALVLPAGYFLNVIYLVIQGGAVRRDKVSIVNEEGPNVFGRFGSFFL
ncbi:MAG: hypothetical protein E5V96_09835 [Mesorhizobium sp.]|nr:MAG: hypothetical protein E5V96_09835 [Mesorhizobium sp.]